MGEYYYIKLMMGCTAVTSQPHPRVQIDTVAIICKTKGMKSGVDHPFFSKGCKKKKTHNLLSCKKDYV